MAKEFVIVKIGSTQQKVSKGDEIMIDKQDGKVGDKLKFDEVLLSNKKGKISIGKPKVARASVEAKITHQGRSRKLKIAKYKAKSRYRRKMGQRREYTKVKIVKI